MSTPSPIARQRVLLHELASVAAEKALAEPALARSFLAERESADKAHQEACDSVRQRMATVEEALSLELRETREMIQARWAEEQEAAQKESGATRRELTDRFDAEKEAAEAGIQEAHWAAEAVREGANNDAATRLRENNARLAKRIDELWPLHEEARALLKGWNQPVSEIEESARTTPRPDKQSLRKISECIGEVHRRLAGLKDLVVPRFLKGDRLLGLTLLAWLVLVFPLGWLSALLLDMGSNLAAIFAFGLVLSTVLSALGWLIARTVIEKVARRQVAALYRPMCEALLDAEATRQQLLRRYQSEHDQVVRDARELYERELAKSLPRQKKLKDVERRRTAELARVEEQLQAQRTSSEQRRADDLLTAEQRHRLDLTRAEQEHDARLEQAESRHKAQREQIETRHLAEWQALVEKWQRALATVQKNVAEINSETDALFPPWDDPFWNDWRARSALPPVMRFGSYRVQAEGVVDAVPWADDRPAPAALDFALPALCAFPEPSSILFHAHDEGKNQAVGALRTIMFRLLTSAPPGKVRFLIVDPVGLGQNFAAFLNLSDYDEALVGGRAWTEAVHVEQRLADLTAHMENVIQKYLRNRYATIEEYNAQAGEVAEPYRVLVVANFPTNFTPEAARRLVSIAQSGARCGVSTLLSIDTRQELPKGLDLADLERCGTNLEWEDGRFRWRDDDFSPYPLALDQMPMEGDDFCNRILHQVGEGARNAQRVEVPFEFIAPSPAEWWTGSTRQGVSVPLGRAGATRRQLLELGKGTSQHALIVGKTGSGKSTLMHALITNLALFYSPDEIELYLIDFKKGVEFKTYATHELPHARVVAIESEREFGLSVLQRLDAELKLRGERFRAAGAQDVAAYRLAVPEARAPRILLIVDEFQEFFVEDDRITQETARLLDRLVRQGRAFGMHVLLGSQTLGGAYSLARSTIDQMAVRIALQCSAVDAHLILSDDNSAARLLSRPGEAIYNDANGLVEGNDPFQVVWLSEAQREQYLTRVRELAEQRPSKPRPATVVFEGNASADVSRNHLLNRLLAGPAPLPVADEGPSSRAEEAWLGEAMALDELTSATFRRRNGSNLLIVGQQPETALGMLATGVIGLAAHSPPAANGADPMRRFTIVDGHQADAPRTGALARLPDVLPEPVRVVGWRDLRDVLAELSAELDRRQKGAGAVPPAVYLVLYALHRMRDLRRQEDDFGFSGRGEEQAASPDKQLATLLREGAGLGIHVLIWCDTLNNLQRAIDRQALRELAMRVVFQLSVSDSSNLIDSPAASKLGLHRALFSNEEDGRLEKFRPYGAPSEEWLARVREELGQRKPLSQTAEPQGAPVP